MKRIISILLVLLLTLSLVACGSSNTTSEPLAVATDAPTLPESTPEPTQEPEPLIAEINLNTPFKIGGFEFVISNCSIIDKSDVPYNIIDLFNFANVDSQSFVYIETTIRNGEKAEKWFRYFDYFSIDYDDGYVFNKYYGAFYNERSTPPWENMSVSMNLQPLAEPLQCRLYFSIPDVAATNTASPLLFEITINEETAALKIR